MRTRPDWPHPRPHPRFHLSATPPFLPSDPPCNPLYSFEPPFRDLQSSVPVSNEHQTRRLAVSAQRTAHSSPSSAADPSPTHRLPPAPVKSHDADSAALPPMSRPLTPCCRQCDLCRFSARAAWAHRALVPLTPTRTPKRTYTHAMYNNDFSDIITRRLPRSTVNGFCHADASRLQCYHHASRRGEHAVHLALHLDTDKKRGSSSCVPRNFSWARTESALESPRRPCCLIRCIVPLPISDPPGGCPPRALIAARKTTGHQRATRMRRFKLIHGCLQGKEPSRSQPLQ